jgi:phytoene dehydrogenase-like protein
MKKYDAIVVGAGISGLLAALTLSKHGKKVLILEKGVIWEGTVIATW